MRSEICGRRNWYTLEEGMNKSITEKKALEPVKTNSIFFFVSVCPLH